MKNEVSHKIPHIGDIFLMNFSGTGNEQTGWRPGLVLQNNVGNEHSPNIIALPLTTAIKKMGQPTHVLVRSSDTGLQKDSVVLCENPERMSKARLGSYLTSLSDEYMADVAVAYLLATSVISYIDMQYIYDVWIRAVDLNAG